MIFTEYDVSVATVKLPQRTCIVRVWNFCPMVLVSVCGSFRLVCLHFPYTYYRKSSMTSRFTLTCGRTPVSPLRFRVSSINGSSGVRVTFVSVPSVFHLPLYTQRLLQRTFGSSFGYCRITCGTSFQKSIAILVIYPLLSTCITAWIHKPKNFLLKNRLY